MRKICKLLILNDEKSIPDRLLGSLHLGDFRIFGDEEQRCNEGNNDQREEEDLCSQEVKQTIAGKERRIQGVNQKCE